MPISAGAPVDFSDGDTYKRVTVNDPACTPRSAILVSVIRPDTAADDDPGWVYVATVVSRTNGSFDVAVAAQMWGEPIVNDEAPAEVVAVAYSINS